VSIRLIGEANGPGKRKRRRFGAVSSKGRAALSPAAVGSGGVLRDVVVGRAVTLHVAPQAQPLAGIAIQARHVLAAVVLVAHGVTLDISRRPGSHAAAGEVEVFLGVAVAALLQLVAEQAAQNRAGRRAGAAVDLVAQHAARDGAEGGALADARALLLAHFLVVARARIPAFLPGVTRVDGLRGDDARV